MKLRLFYHLIYGVVIIDKLKISVYAICKNEEKFVKRWVESMSEADEIFVTDTGSSDGTAELLKEAGVNVQSIALEEWRFDTARNISLGFVSEDTDICVCTDLDEVFEKGWREKLEKAWVKGETTRARYGYTWSFKKDGTPDVTFILDKIHARKGYKWVHPVHEILKYENGAERFTKTDIQLNHYPDSAKSRGQYLPLLELSVKEDPNDDRNVHYLGREYMFYGQWDKCIETLKRHLILPSAVWLDERSASMRYIARCYRAKGDFKNASVWLYRAIAEAPYLREPYVETAYLAYLEKNWEKVYFMVNEALKIKNRPQTYINEGFCWDSTVYDLGAVAAFNLELYQKSLELAEMACAMNPNDERLRDNLEIIKKSVINGNKNMQ